MTRKMTLALTTIASCCLLAAPSYAQYSYNSGTNYGSGTPAPSSSRATRSTPKTTTKADRKLREAQALKEAYEKELLMKEKAMAKQTGSMTYGSGSPAPSAAGSATTYGTPATAPSALPTNCPANTTPQPNGSCMLK